MRRFVAMMAAASKESSADIGETSETAQLLREASSAGGLSAVETQGAEKQPRAQQPAQQPAAERQLEAEQQPRAEKERQPAPEQQPGVTAPPTGQFWQTDDSDSEEEEEEEEEKTAGWKAGRTVATFERYTRFADLDAVASRRPVL